MEIFYKIFCTLSFSLIFHSSIAHGWGFTFLDFGLIKFFTNINLELDVDFKYILNQMIETFQMTDDLDNPDNGIHNDLSHIQAQLQHLSSNIELGFQAIEREIKTSDINSMKAEQMAYVDRFKATVNSASNETDLMGKIESLMENYIASNIENKMVNLLDSATPGVSSLIMTIIKAFKDAVEQPPGDVRSSPNRLMYDFYMSIMHSVFQGYYFMEQCVLITDYLEKSLHEEKHEYFREITKISATKIIDSMKKMVEEFGSEQLHRLSYKVGTSGGDFVEPSGFYMGVSKAPDKHVITGVRFQIYEEEILYIQIQVGKLADHGQIDSSTVYWLEPNEDIDVNFRSFPGKKFIIETGIVDLENAALTGLQFRMDNQTLSLIAYGHEIVDHNKGCLGSSLLRKSLTRKDDGNFQKFFSAKLELDIKAPLSGVAFYVDESQVFIPQLITYDIHNFVNETTLDASIAVPMSNYAKIKLRRLIGEFGVVNVQTLF